MPTLSLGNKNHGILYIMQTDGFMRIGKQAIRLRIKDGQKGVIRMERIHNSLYVLHHLIGGIGQSSWELSYPVYRFDCGDLTGDSCPEIAVRCHQDHASRSYPGQTPVPLQTLPRAARTGRHLPGTPRIRHHPLGYRAFHGKNSSPLPSYEKGVKAAVFNAVLFPLENWQHAEGQPDVCRPSIDRLAGRIRQYKAEHPSSFIVAVLHWGTEFQPHPPRTATLLRPQTDASRDGCHRRGTIRTSCNPRNTSAPTPYSTASAISCSTKATPTAGKPRWPSCASKPPKCKHGSFL